MERNFVPLHKQRDKECAKNCSPISLLLICSKYSERFRCNEMFLDISKTFEKICHEVLLLMLNGNGISGNLLKLLGNFPISKTRSSFKWTPLIFG